MLKALKTKQIPIVLSVGFLLSLLIAVVFLKIGNSALEQDTLFKLDKIIINMVVNTRSPFLTKVMILITNLASKYAVSFLTLTIAAILFTRKKRFEAVVFPMIVFSTAGSNFLLKFAFHKPRPVIETLVKESSYSFPSGHAMISIVIYSLIAIYLFKSLENKHIKLVILIFFSLIILLIGFSRIYLGVHYPSDVFAGYLAGFFILLSSYLVKLYLDQKSNHLLLDEGC